MEILKKTRKDINNLFLAGLINSHNSATLKNDAAELRATGNPALLKLAENLVSEDFTKLMDACMLSDALSFVSAKNGISGTINKFDNDSDIELKPLSYQLSASVINAFTVKSSKRMQIINDAIANGIGIDIRFKNALLDALDDTNNDVQSTAATLLIDGNIPCAEEILESFDIKKGTQSSFHKLRVLVHMYKDKNFYEKVIEKGNVNLKPLAIIGLADYPEYEQKFIELSDDKNDQVASGAITALIKMKSNETDVIVSKHLSDNSRAVINAIIDCNDDCYKEKLLDTIFKNVLKLDENTLFALNSINYRYKKFEAFKEKLSAIAVRALTRTSVNSWQAYGIIALIYNIKDQKTAAALAKFIGVCENLGSENISNAIKYIHSWDSENFHEYCRDILKKYPSELTNTLLEIGDIKLDKEWLDMAIETKSYTLAALSAVYGEKDDLVNFFEKASSNIMGLSAVDCLAAFYRAMESFDDTDSQKNSILNKIMEIMSSDHFISHYFKNNNTLYYRLSRRDLFTEFCLKNANIMLDFFVSLKIKHNINSYVLDALIDYCKK